MGILSSIYRKLTGKNQAYETSESEKVNFEEDEYYQNADAPVSLINDEYETKLECMENSREFEGALTQSTLALSNNDDMLVIDSPEMLDQELSSELIESINHRIEGSDNKKIIASDANTLVINTSTDEADQGTSRTKDKQGYFNGIPLNHYYEHVKEDKPFYSSFTLGNMGKVKYYNSFEKYRDTDFFGITNTYERRLILEEMEDYLRSPYFYSNSSE